MRPFARIVTLGLVLAAGAPSASAHHSPVMFDQSRTLSLEGTVRQFQWINPYCCIQLVVADGQRQTEWNMEMDAPVRPDPSASRALP